MFEAASELCRWISEKLDGIRASWDGKRLISKQGREIMCPQWFLQGLPTGGISLDGELWMGNGTLDNLMAVLNSTVEENWKGVKYLVFDMPGSSKQFEERMDELKKLKLPPQVSVVRHELCTGNTHVKEYLEKISAEGGEGLMLNKPGSFYVGERTDSLLKLIARSNGVEVVVGCDQQAIGNPPPIGAVVTVQHNGYHHSGALRHSFYWRQRPDIQWSDVPKETRLLSPNANWNIADNQTEFFNRLMLKWGFEKLEDFYNITPEQVKENGGKALLDYCFSGSLPKALGSVYPNHEWSPWKFRQKMYRGYWDSPESQRAFVGSVGKELGYKAMEDWYEVTADQFMKRGGVGLMDKFNRSPSRILRATYPEHKWIPWKFSQVPRGHWNEPQNQREFLGWLGKELVVQKWEDWYRITQGDICDNGARDLLLKFGNSPAKLIQSVFVEHKWDLGSFQEFRYNGIKLGN